MFLKELHNPFKQFQRTIFMPSLNLKEKELLGEEWAGEDFPIWEHTFNPDIDISEYPILLAVITTRAPQQRATQIKNRLILGADESLENLFVVEDGLLKSDNCIYAQEIKQENVTWVTGYKTLGKWKSTKEMYSELFG